MATEFDEKQWYCLVESVDGIFQAGSYYDYIVGVIEESLNNFLSDTEFPYHSSASGEKMEVPVRNLCTPAKTFKPVLICKVL